jgi:hypothetical protein
MHRITLTGKTLTGKTLTHHSHTPYLARLTLTSFRHSGFPEDPVSHEGFSEQASGRGIPFTKFHHHCCKSER